MTGLDELYDPCTLRAIDGWPSRAPRPTVGGARGTTVAGALLLAGLTGVREVVEPIRPAVAVVRPDPGLDRADAVTVLLASGAPAASVAVVRPWLLEVGPIA